jgi:proline iminopeptidase
MRLARITPLAAVLACSQPAPSDSPLVATDDSLITADSVRLYYRVIGSGAETVIVPLAVFHGTQLDALARHHRLVVYDPRGRGRSDTVPPAKISLKHNLRDLDTLRATVGADRVALIGWSGLGMELFVYTLWHPERVTRLVQLAPVAPRWHPWVDSLGADRARRTDSTGLATLRRREARGDFENDPAGHCRARAEVFTPATFGDPSLVRLAPDLCVYPTEWPDRIGSYFGALMRSIEGFDWTDSLSRVAQVPRLVIHGELDNTPLKGNREWVAGHPNARLLVVQGAGHWPHYERPEVVLPAIERFLKGDWPEAAQRYER